MQFTSPRILISRKTLIYCFQSVIVYCHNKVGVSSDISPYHFTNTG
nr:MAG TPA: hypothetical protein [Caudoviricetes sp.]